MLGWLSNATGHGGQPFAPMYTYSQIVIKDSDGNELGSYPTDALDLAVAQGNDTKAHYSHDDFDWHSLRHFTAHFFYVVRGYGPELAAYQLGHTDPNLVIRRYGKPFQGALDRLKRASESPRVVPLRSVDEDARKGGRGA